MSNSLINPNKILLGFVIFFSGMIVSFFALNIMVVKPHTVKANQIVNTVVKDAKRSERFGAMTVVTQCQELGYAFVESSDSDGYTIDCNQASVNYVNGEAFEQKRGQYKQFASKLSNRPLITPGISEQE